ncbi:MAG: efflux RND transporter periplasmic adaptor subunit [bacterium]
MRWFRLILRIVLLVVVIGGGVWGTRTILDQKTEAQRRPPPPATRLTVEAIQVQPTDYQINVNTFGTIQPHTQSTLVSQVSGSILRIAPSFREGGFFEKGALLLEIDPTEYEAEVRLTEMALTQSYLTLKEEQARSQQAIRNWQRLGQQGFPSDLAMRRPQLEVAKSAIESGRIRLAKAKRNLERTRVVAPYAGRIMEQMVDIGQYVGTGTQLAKIYSIDYVEVRLPLHSAQLEYVNLPEEYRSSRRQKQNGPVVQFEARIGQQSFPWEGRISRTEGVFDANSRQLHVVAQIRNPYESQKDGKPPLKIGQFVAAEIEGRLIKNALVIPRQAIYQGNEVVLVRDNKLHRQPVDILWSNAEEAVISNGLTAGDLLTLTPVGSLPSGTEVNALLEGRSIQEGAPDQKRRRERPGKPEAADAAKNDSRGSAPRQNVEKVAASR